MVVLGKNVNTKQIKNIFAILLSNTFTAFRENSTVSSERCKVASDAL